MVVHFAIPIKLTYAGAVSLVERKSTAHPNLLKAKKDTMASSPDRVSRATTGAFSAFGSYNGQPSLTVRDLNALLLELDPAAGTTDKQHQRICPRP